MKIIRIASVIIAITFMLSASVMPPVLGSLTNIVGDLDGNGVVDIKDLAILMQAFGAYPGHIRWNAEADLNRDGKIDIIDAALLFKHIGETAPTKVVTTRVFVKPHKLKLSSHGKWIKCIIEIPKDYNIREVDPSTIKLNETIGIDSNAPIIAVTKGCTKTPRLMVRFRRDEVIRLIKNTLDEIEIEDHEEEEVIVHHVTLTVTGKLSNKVWFKGHTRIHVIFKEE